MEFSHLDDKGKPSMVDVGNKPDQQREALAQGFILLGQQTLKAIKEDNIKKGNVLVIAQIAGIQAAKRTSDLIPLCHQLALTKVDVDLEIQENGIQVRSKVRCLGKTGVEMEALTAVATSLLTIYDMCKAIDKQMVLKDVFLVDKIKRDV